jgi:general secretion pathway protein G
MVDNAMSMAAGHTRPRQSMHGFTLLEIMVVVVILGILAALVAPQILGRVEDARVAKANQDIRAFETALNLYRLDNYKFPTTEQGLKALKIQPSDSSVRNWKKGGYIDELRSDPWEREYIYVYPGTHGKEFDLFTLGADGQEGGEGPDADIGNWEVAGKQ